MENISQSWNRLAKIWTAELRVLGWKASSNLQHRHNFPYLLLPISSHSSGGQERWSPHQHQFLRYINAVESTPASACWRAVPWSKTHSGICEPCLEPPDLQCCWKKGLELNWPHKNQSKALSTNYQQQQPSTNLGPQFSLLSPIFICNSYIPITGFV